jgi:hypothetical protein
MMMTGLTSGMTKTIGILACLLMMVHPSLQQQDATINNNNKQSLFRQRRKVIEVDSLNPHTHQHDTVTMYHDVEHNHHQSPIRRMRKVNVEPRMTSNVDTAVTNNNNNNNNHHQYDTLLANKEVASHFVFDRLLEDLFSPASSLSFSFSMCMSFSMSM